MLLLHDVIFFYLSCWIENTEYEGGLVELAWTNWAYGIHNTLQSYEHVHCKCMKI